MGRASPVRCTGPWQPLSGQGAVMACIPVSFLCWKVATQGSATLNMVSLNPTCPARALTQTIICGVNSEWLINPLWTSPFLFLFSPFVTSSVTSSPFKLYKAPSGKSLFITEDASFFILCLYDCVNSYMHTHIHMTHINTMGTHVT